MAHGNLGPQAGLAHRADEDDGGVDFGSTAVCSYVVVVAAGLLLHGRNVSTSVPLSVQYFHLSVRIPTHGAVDYHGLTFPKKVGSRN